MSHDPLSPSEALRTPIGVVLAALSLLVFVYSLVIVGQILFGVIVVLTLSVGPYVSYRSFAALDALADGAQRLADTREREVERDSRDSRFDRPVDRDASEARDRSSTTERVTEREG